MNLEELSDNARRRYMTDARFHARVRMAERILDAMAGPIDERIRTATVATILEGADQPVTTPDGQPQPVDLGAVGRRYSRALDAKPGKGPLTRLDWLIDSVADIPALIQEIEQLRKEKP